MVECYSSLPEFIIIIFIILIIDVPPTDFFKFV